MADLPLSLVSGAQSKTFEGSGGFGSFLQQAALLAGQFLVERERGKMGGGPIMGLVQQPSQPTGVDVPFVDVTAQGQCPPGVFLKQGASTSLRFRPEIIVEHPTTGAVRTYRNMGRPLLYSGDLSASRRVNKIAGRARRARGSSTRRRKR